MTKKTTTTSVADRVQNSLYRYGFETISAIDLGDQTVELRGLTESANDLAIAVAIARTVPGVVRVAYQREGH
ncbi:hypothetical protein [Novipirellula caenicola]|uniref:BON domain-containing protein n=1 Tax=Novipirellula caenicola TaxID=1536901 RepID=A0ABP9VQK3_9BACT